MTESHDCKDHEEEFTGSLRRLIQADSTLGIRATKLSEKKAHGGYHKGRGGITGFCGASGL